AVVPAAPSESSHTALILFASALFGLGMGVVVLLRVRGSAAAARRGAPVPAPAPPVPAVADDGFETCTIAWSRGYRKSDFYAVAASGDELHEVARSPMFRWRSASQPPAESEGIFEAHSALV